MKHFDVFLCETFIIVRFLYLYFFRSITIIFTCVQSFVQIISVFLRESLRFLETRATPMSLELLEIGQIIQHFLSILYRILFDSFVPLLLILSFCAFVLHMICKLVCNFQSHQLRQRKVCSFQHVLLFCVFRFCDHYRK